MVALRYVDVVPGADGPAVIDMASIRIDDLGLDVAADHSAHCLFRLYSAAPVSTVGIYELLRSAMVRSFRPDSVVRRTLQHEIEDLVRTAGSKWFSLEIDRSVLRTLSIEELRASAHAWSTLGAARAMSPVVFLQMKGSWPETESVIERLRAEIETTQALIDAHRSRPVPAATPRPKVNALLDQLLARDWPNSAEVGSQLGSASTTNAAQYASQLRAQNKLFGVWSTTDRTYRHPMFQFDVAGQVLPGVPDLLAALADPEDTRGWRRVLWLYGPRDELSGPTSVEARSPADVFAEDPERVIALANADRKGLESADASW
jgi:hypothetical protein